jgi:hypothetical protein
MQWHTDTYTDTFTTTHRHRCNDAEPHTQARIQIHLYIDAMAHIETHTIINIQT